MIQKSIVFSGPKLIQNGLRQNGKLFCGQMNQDLKLFLETMDIVSCEPKRRGTIQLVISTVQKPASLKAWGCIHIYGVGSWNIWKGSINAEEEIEVFEQHMLSSTQHVCWGRPCIFQDNAEPHTASQHPNSMTSQEKTGCWTGLSSVCSPDLSPRENIWPILKWNIQQWWPRTVELLESWIRQEWDNIPPLKLQQLVFSLPRSLQMFI